MRASKKGGKKSPNERISAASKEKAATRSSGAAGAMSRLQANGGGQTKTSKDGKKPSTSKGGKFTKSKEKRDSSHKRESWTAEEKEQMRKDRKVGWVGLGSC